MGKKYRVRILDGNNVNHYWTVEVEDKHNAATNKQNALAAVRKSWKVYGIPYGIEKDGIKFSDVYAMDEI